MQLVFFHLVVVIVSVKLLKNMHEVCDPIVLIINYEACSFVTLGDLGDFIFSTARDRGHRGAFLLGEGTVGFSWVPQLSPPSIF